MSTIPQKRGPPTCRWYPAGIQRCNFRKTSPLALVLLLLALAACDYAHAQAPSADSFNVKITEQNLAPVPPITLVRVRAGSTRVVFVAPRGFRSRNHEDRSEVRFLSPDDSCSVNLAFRPADAAPAAGTSPESAAAELAARWHTSLLTRYPGAKILEAFTETAGGTSGPACDLLWTNDGRGELKLRLTLLRFGAHWVELTLISAPASFEQNRHACNDVLLTLRAAEGQDPPAPEFSNKI
ncbi:hypothetical protein LBMAG56_39090 [Verrucomicrobiota bacterium]|nr:hypothetical protein LBMAG56_39090 [Verrucomicrobiota bacterium]